jgi:hypothetical protein
MLSLIAEVDEFKGPWRAIRRFSPKQRSSLRRVNAIKSIGSSTRFEGTFLTDCEVEKLLAKFAWGSSTTGDEQAILPLHNRRNHKAVASQ